MSIVAGKSFLAAATRSSSTLRTSRSATACPALVAASDSDRLLSALRIFFASPFRSESLILTREAISFRRSALIQTPFSFPETAVRNASVLSSPFPRASWARSRPATRRSSPSFFFSTGTPANGTTPPRNPRNSRNSTIFTSSPFTVAAVSFFASFVEHPPPNATAIATIAAVTPFR